MERLTRLQRACTRHGLRGLIRRGMQQPTRAIDMIISPSGHFYDLESPVYWEDIVTIIPPLVEASPSRVANVWSEVHENEEFVEEIESRLSETDERPSNLHSNWREFLYVLVRLQEPTHVVETGIYDGLSSAYILSALRKNGQGKLTSIDINDETRLPSDLDDSKAGWVVPTSLRDRWICRYGDAKELLPTVVAEQPPEIFLHDSLHTKEHMQFEFKTVISEMSGGDLILTDNSRFNRVFQSLAKHEFDKASFWKNTRYAYNSSGEKIDDRLGIGILK